MKRARVFPLLLLVIAVVWFGWLRAQVAPPPSISELPKNLPAPDFTLTDQHGRIHRLSDYRGKVVIVNFWATWCPPCREEMPSMQRAWEQLEPEGVVMLGVNVGEDKDTVSRFADDYFLDFPLLLDVDSEVSSRWPVQGLPTTFVIDTTGHLAFEALGEREWDSPEVLAPVRALNPSSRLQKAERQSDAISLPGGSIQRM